jgi:GNAT superfamily N-acetyltransferase
MTDVTSAKSARRPHHWRRDLVELAALFTAVVVAEAIANMIAHVPDGTVLLIASAVALIATAAFHTWWSRRHSHAPPQASLPRPAAEGPVAARPAATSLWRMRTTVRDEPGSLAALCTAFAEHRVDILTLQTHPLAHGVVDEFLLRSPAAFGARDLTREIAAAGGTDTWIERADAHDLVDTPTRVLGLATRTALDAAELPLALSQLLGRCTIHSQPPAPSAGHGPDTSVPVEGVLEGTSMRLGEPNGGTISVDRPYLPFTPTEFARARALVELDSRLGPRVPRSEDVLTLPEGQDITIRRAGPDDHAAALAMHGRCSERTLSLRYHGPAADADRYLDHLLSPRFGRTLAVQTASGRIVALGHLLWDGDETEVALIVEDGWQQRGIGSELLGKLTALAAEARCSSVYAVTQSSNTGMVAAMRALGLPLDYQLDNQHDSTLVVTARLNTAPVRPTLPGAGSGHPGSEQADHERR